MAGNDDNAEDVATSTFVITMISAVLFIGTVFAFIL